MYTASADCNNFCVSCERVFNRSLNGKPLVVLSNNDGCAVSLSNEAEVTGIPAAAPAFKHQKLFEQHHITVFSFNYALYGDMSSRVMNIHGNIALEPEIYSIDETFLGFHGFENFDL